MLPYDLFVDDNHRNAWKDIMQNKYPLAMYPALFVLTGMDAHCLHRFKKSIHANYIDFDEILHGISISHGERYMVEWAANLYNAAPCSPFSILHNCDEKYQNLAINAMKVAQLTAHMSSNSGMNWFQFWNELKTESEP